jgi:hypothetical protein
MSNSSFIQNITPKEKKTIIENKKILKIYEESNLIIQSFDLSEILDKNGKYKKNPSNLPFKWQEQTVSNIIPNQNGYLMRTGTKIGEGENEKYIIAIDVDNKDDFDEYKNGLTYWNQLLKEKNYNVTTATQSTGNNGFHFLFTVSPEKYKHVSSNITGLKINKQRYTIDIKATKACIYCEPSNYTSLENGKIKEYKWIIKPKIKNFQILPDFLYELIYNHHKNNTTSQTPIKKTKKSNIITNEINIEKRELKNPIDLTNLKVSRVEEKLLYILDPDRFIATSKWWNIGIIMKSLNFNYEMYSKLSKKDYLYYTDIDCLRNWESYRKKTNYDMGLLHYIAKLDNPEEYEKLNIIASEEIININRIEIKKRYLIDIDNENLKTENCILSENIKTFFMDEKIKSLSIKSPYDTGKTQLIKKILDKYQQKRILWISYRKTLTNDILSTFEKKYNFKNYQDGIYTADRLIIQLESLMHLTSHNFYDEEIEIPSYDLILIDESESVLQQYSSSTFKGYSKQTFEFMTAIMHNSKKLIFMDGDMGNRSYNLIKHFGESINIINNIQINQRHFIFTKNRDFITNDIMQDIEDEKKIVIVSMSSKKAIEYRDIISEKYKDKKILIYTGNSDDNTKNDLKDVIGIWSKCDVLIYSPSIESGVSFDLEYFDNMYGIITNKSTSPRAFMQMLNRIRKIKNTTIKILNEVFNMTNMSDYDIVKKTNMYKYSEVKQGIMSLESIKLSNEIIEKNGKKIMLNKLTLYDENYIYNKQEKLNSSHHYFLPSLLIMIKNKGHTYEIEESEKSKNKKTKTKNEMILEVKDITDEEYNICVDKQKKGMATEEDKNKIQKHSLKKIYGVERLNKEILKLDTYKIKNFVGLLDINNINKIDDNQTKENIKKIEMINELINNIGFDNIYDTKYIEKQTIEEKRNEIMEKTSIFKDEMIKKVLFNESKHIHEITTNKAFLGYINSLLSEYCLKINSSLFRLKKLKQNEMENMTKEQIKHYEEKQKKQLRIYKLERLYNIDEIIDYKIKNKYKLIDEKNIRKNYEKTTIFKDLIN